MAAPSMHLYGANELLARFVKAAALGEVAAVEGADAMAEDIAASARNLAPVDTGYLQSTIEADGNRVTVGAPYAAFVEYGTSTNPAEPFFRPAIDGEDGGHALQVVAAVMEKI